MVLLNVQTQYRGDSFHNFCVTISLRNNILTAAYAHSQMLELLMHSLFHLTVLYAQKHSYGTGLGETDSQHSTGRGLLGFAEAM